MEYVVVMTVLCGAIVVLSSLYYVIRFSYFFTVYMIRIHRSKKGIKAMQRLQIQKARERAQIAEQRLAKRGKIANSSIMRLN